MELIISPALHHHGALVNAEMVHIPMELAISLALHHHGVPEERMDAPKEIVFSMVHHRQVEMVEEETVHHPQGVPVISETAISPDHHHQVAEETIPVLTETVILPALHETIRARNEIAFSLVPNCQGITVFQETIPILVETVISPDLHLQVVSVTEETTLVLLEVLLEHLRVVLKDMEMALDLVCTEVL